jgi:murein DD-endopeptidase MepM/ murein hydrolase activator NlpD
VPASSSFARLLVVARSWLTPLLLAGLLPLSLEMVSRWPVASLWMFPVGEARNATLADTSGEPGYAITRNVGGAARHQGADLSNRQAGGVVRAAADGIVVFAGARVPDHGYGQHVVLAHRLPEGGVAYTVYAHLAVGSIAVRQGATVEIGDRLGAVGSTGVATSPHLHFEVRLAHDPQERWEKAPVLDPMAFVGTHQASAEADSASTTR